MERIEFHLNWLLLTIWSDWVRVFSFRDYNTRVVIAGTMLLGMAAGMIGSFTLLRRRALMGDALSHATLPGVGLAFLLAPLAGLDGKSQAVLLTGAAISGVAGVGAILFVRRLTRLQEDAALGIVLSVFFGAGITILSVIQQTSSGHAAGLEAFIYGKTASMVAADAWLIGWSGIICMLIAVLLFKELTLLCFDEGYASARGYPIFLLDLALMALVVIITIIGLQAVGLVLMIALLVIPAAAARFWTQRMNLMTIISAVIGAVSGLAGSAVSAILPRLPSGAMIVLVSSGIFFISMMVGPTRGVAVRLIRRLSFNRSIDRQHLLRAIYESLEHRELSDTKVGRENTGITVEELLAARSWSAVRLQRQIRRSRRARLIEIQADGSVVLTSAGRLVAARLVHEHRLWELYLITHADIAPGRVDRNADAIEHVLDSGMIAQLEQLLQQRQSVEGIARSPHPVSAEASKSAKGWKSAERWESEE